MSYNVYWNPKVAGKVGHFDWHLPNLGQVSLLNGNTDPGPFDISADPWDQVREKTLSLKPQVQKQQRELDSLALDAGARMWARWEVEDAFVLPAE